MKDKTIVILLVVVVFFAGVWFYFNKKSPVVSVGKNIVSTGTTSSKAGDIVGSKKSASLGEYLTDSKGMTLYTFSDDTRLTSNCTGDCLKKWPSYAYDNKNVASSTDALSKRMNVIKRSDGTYQYAYSVQPVYYYSGDKTPGDTNGLGGDKWNLILVK